MKLTKTELELIYKISIKAIILNEDAMSKTNPGTLHFWNLSDELSKIECLKVKVMSHILTLNAKIDGN